MTNPKISGSQTQIAIQVFYSRIRDEARRIAAETAKLPDLLEPPGAIAMFILDDETDEEILTFDVPG
jgi:hypothetical protein